MPERLTYSGENLLEILKALGGYVEGHFLFTSGLHGEVFFNKNVLYPHPNIISSICADVAQRHASLDIDAVIGPSMGGIILSQWTAYHLNKLAERPVLSLHSEKDADGKQVLKRGYEDLVSGKRVLCVEDVLTTGGSLRQVVDISRYYGGEVIAAAALVNRAPSTVTTYTIDTPLTSLLEMETPSYTPDTCPACAKGIPISRSIGKG